MASVYQRPGSKYWYATITLPSGKQKQFSTRLEDKDEALEVAQRAEQATKRHKAEAQLRKAMSAIVSDVVGFLPVEAPKFFRDWLERRRSEVSEKTADIYSIAIEEVAEYMVANNRRDLGEVTVSDVVALRDKWSHQRAAATTNMKLSILRMALKDALAARLVPDNVAAHVRGVKNSGAAKRLAFTREQLQAILAHCEPDWRALCLLALYTGGQRFGDLATLRWKNVDLVKGAVNASAKKTSRPIILPIVPALSDALAGLESSDDPDAFLFPELATISQNTRSKRFRAILCELGLVAKRERKNERTKKGTRAKYKLSELSFHSFRHTATTMLKAAGVGEGIAKAIVGHESQAISDNYTHIPMETMREALEKLGRF